jgi:small subunit ribosomal protein S2
VIPANDDAVRSIEIVVSTLCKAIQEGLEERKMDKDKETEEVEAAERQQPGKKLRARKGAKPVDVEAEAPAAEPVQEEAPKAE